MSPNPNPGPWEPKSFGETVADHVIALAQSAKTETPAHPTVKGMVDTFHFKNCASTSKTPGWSPCSRRAIFRRSLTPTRSCMVKV